MPSTPSSSIVTKCTRVLDILAESGRPIGFTEVVELSGFAKSSTHRILAILMSEGLAEYCGRGKVYRLGPTMMNWVLKIWRSSDIRQAAHQQLEMLAETTGHNAALATRDGDRVLYIRTVDSYPVRYAPKVGEHAPLHCTAVGKVLLAYLPGVQQKKWVATLAMERLTEHSIRNRALLAGELKKIKKRGFAVSNREEFLQVCGVAAPIFGLQGNISGSVCIWSLTERADLAALRRFIPLLTKTAGKISARLGYKDA